MLPNIKKILYTTDLSENAKYAFEYALGIAKRFDATLTILHVLESPSLTSDSLVINILGREKWEELRRTNEQEVVRTIRERLNRYCEEIKEEMPECPYIAREVIVKIGLPADEILETAEKIKADLVIMGAHGLGFLATAMIGSTSRRVLRRCKKPVLVVRLPEKE